MSAPQQMRTPLTSPKGSLSISIVWVYIGMWAYAVYTVLQMINTPIPTGTTPPNPMGFLLEFAGATGVMGMIVLLVVQNFFRKTEAG